MNKIYQNKRELVDSLIEKNSHVLDVGFWGQGTDVNSKNWVHGLLLQKSDNVFGLDLDFDINQLTNKENYKKGSAENFDFDVKFDRIFAGDLIEHLSNPGLFLAACRRNLKDNGKLVISTPNCFNLFNLASKITKDEPVVNKDHTCYFNKKTLRCLLAKNGWEIDAISFLYSLEIGHKESFRKKFLNFVYWFLSKFSSKYIETLVVTASPKK